MVLVLGSSRNDVPRHRVFGLEDVLGATGEPPGCPGMVGIRSRPLPDSHRVSRRSGAPGPCDCSERYVRGKPDALGSVRTPSRFKTDCIPKSRGSALSLRLRGAIATVLSYWRLHAPNAVGCEIGPELKAALIQDGEPRLRVSECTPVHPASLVPTESSEHDLDRVSVEDGWNPIVLTFRTGCSGFKVHRVVVLFGMHVRAGLLEVPRPWMALQSGQTCLAPKFEREPHQRVNSLEGPSRRLASAQFALSAALCLDLAITPPKPKILTAFLEPLSESVSEGGCLDRVRGSMDCSAAFLQVAGKSSEPWQIPELLANENETRSLEAEDRDRD